MTTASGMIRLAIGAALIGAMAACDRPPAKQSDVPIVVRSEGQQRLHTLNDLNRAIALKRASYASGSTCRRVTESGYVQEHGNLSMWTASCDDGRAWGIFVAPDETVQVRPCADLAQLKLPACVIAPKPSEPSAPAD